MADVLVENLDVITDSTTFDELWIRINTDRGYIQDLLVLNEGEFVGQVQNFGRTTPLDESHESYEIARDAVVAGTATVKYLLEYGRHVDPETESVYEKDDIPDRFKYRLQWDTFSADVAAQEQQVEDVRWSELTFFRYIDSSSLTVPVPGFSDGDVDGLIEDMETGGWYQTTSAAYTNKGTNTILRTAIVSYEYVGSTDTSTVSVSIIPRDNIRYSIDGITFTDDPPDDENDITHLEITVGGESIDFTIKPATELVNPVERLISEAYPPWQGSLSTPQVNSFGGADFNRLYALQLHMWEAPGWSDVHTVIRGGFSPLIPIDEIQLTSPQLIGQDAFSNHDDVIEGNVGYYVLRFGRTESQGQGKVELFQVNSDNLPDYDDGYSVWLICFESYPVTTLHNAVPNSAAASVRIFGTGRGISTGNTLFVNDEEMEVTGMSDSQLIGSDVTTLIAVDRGVNGTTATSHEVGDRIRAILNADRIRNIVFFGSRNQSVPQPLRILGYKRPLEVT